MVKAETVKRTEAELLDMLRQRHVRPGNGGSGEYAFMTHVRNGAGFKSNRTFDAVVMRLWPSRGMVLHAYEVKCSRSDWLRELKEPAKAEAAAELVDRFSMVVADDTIIRDGELPPTWGLLVAKGSALRMVKDAPMLPGADLSSRIGRDFVIAMLRAGGAVPQAEAAGIESARQEGIQRGIEMMQSGLDAALERERSVHERISRFEDASGVPLNGWSRGQSPEVVGAALRSVLQADQRVEHGRQALVRARDDLLRAAEQVSRVITGDI